MVMALFSLLLWAILIGLIVGLCMRFIPLLNPLSQFIYIILAIMFIIGLLGALGIFPKGAFPRFPML